MFHPFLYNGNQYADGGILDNFPIAHYASEDVLGIKLQTNPNNVNIKFNLNYSIQKVQAVSKDQSK
jgi:predicted acylesterase/phospholipase RssA